MNTRKIALIGIENFNGGPVTTPAQAQWCRTMIEQTLNLPADTLIVVAADKSAVINIQMAWPGIRILPGTGKDGADKRLLEVFEENLPQRFTDISLVSGDHIFAEKISAMAGQGVPTHVYSWPHALSKRLRFAARAVTTTMTYTFTNDREAA